MGHYAKYPTTVSYGDDQELLMYIKTYNTESEIMLSMVRVDSIPQVPFNPANTSRI